MLRNRLIYLGILILTIVYASFYGGNVAYAMLYLVILVPVISFIYTFYVYSRFKIYQDIPVREVTKGEAIPYTFVIENSDIFSFVRVKVDFIDEMASIADSDKLREHCMLPDTNRSYDTTMVCKYRGTYYVGAKSLEVTDFFYLFTIRYKLPTMTKFTIYPRVLKLDRLKSGIDAVDTKNIINRISSDGQVDNDLRKYVAGDNRKLIHWKNSAKKRELLTRKYVDNEMLETVLILDNTHRAEDEAGIIEEDKIIEASLAIAYNYFTHSIPVRVISDGVDILVEDSTTFNSFIKLCADLKFNGHMDIKEEIESMNNGNTTKNYLVITSMLEDKLVYTLRNAISLGNVANVVYIESNETDYTPVEGVYIIKIDHNKEVKEGLAG